MEKFNDLDEIHYAGAEEPIAVKLFEFIKQNKSEIVLDAAAAGGRRPLV